MKIKMTVSETQGAEGIVNAVLKCDSYNLSFFTTSIKLSPNEAKTFDIEPLKLSKAGQCSIKAEFKYADSLLDSAYTSEFTISNTVNITSEINKLHFMPGEKLTISGIVTKADGTDFNGLGEVDFDGKPVSINANNKFSYQRTLENNIKSGKHEIIISLNDSYGNFGQISQEIEVQSIPTSIEIKTNNDSFLPGDELRADINLYDQAGDKINESVAVTLYNPWGIDLKIESIFDDTIFEYNFSSDAEPENWWIYAFADGIKERKFLFVKETAKAEFNIENKTLTIKNIGNIVYQKPVEIIFTSESGESESQVIDTNIPIKKQDSFILSAPDGNYNITIKSNEIEESFSAVLTGKAISVSTTGFKGMYKEIAVILFVALIIFISIFSRYKIRSKNIRVKLSR
jgi:hypothetical protein